MILAINSKDLIALQVQGLSLAMRGQVAESVTPLYKAAQQDPKNPELLSNLAKAQQGAELFHEAIRSYEKLNALIPNNPQILTDMGTAFAKLKRFDKAAECLDRAIQIQPDYFLAWSNRGNLLVDMRLTDEAIASYRKALDINPNYPETWTNCGNAFFDLGRYEEALVHHERALELDPNYGEAWANKGNTLLEMKRGDEAQASFQHAYKLKPKHPYLFGQIFAAKSMSCDWQSDEFSSDSIVALIEDGQAASIPFSLLQTPASAELQKRSSEFFIKDKYPAFSRPDFGSRSLPHEGKVKIGYFSSDFNGHPVGILMENIIRLHDRSKFEIYGFFLNEGRGDSVESSLISLFDQVIRLNGLSDQAAHDLVIGTEIDIAVDLNGHTAGARTSLFSRYLAPIQVNYLGYAGTSGADFYDVLIADQVSIPPEHQVHYTEKIAYLPHSFFPVDTSISIDQFGPVPTRSSQGLPDEGFVFACFNNAYKITPYIFDVWMDLLAKVPGSILWLSKPSAKAIENLHKEAKNRGIDPVRLVFASRVPSRADHLSRLRLADLFLDTPNYNAHATAADALWAGLPVLTLLGNTFAGRVAASQLNALGLEDLIAESIAEYTDKALELASNPALLKELRDRLELNRLTAPLFNTKQYVRDLESLYLGLLK